MIREDDLSDRRVLDLIAFHLAAMHEHSPPGCVFALAPEALKARDVTVWSAWIADRVVGIGALRWVDERTGEVKSMRTHPSFLRRGVGAAILETITRVARVRGLARLSLETGSGAAFDPAQTLYTRRGFTPGAPFGDYRQSRFNRFFHLVL